MASQEVNIKEESPPKAVEPSEGKTPTGDELSTQARAERAPGRTLDEYAAKQQGLEGEKGMGKEKDKADKGKDNADKGMRTLTVMRGD